MTRVGQMYREKLVHVIQDGLDQSANIFVMSFSQVSGLKMSEFRKSLKAADARMFVSKNSIATLALKNLKHDLLAERVSGQTALVWSNTDSVTVSKILVKFAKDLDEVSVQGGILDGHILEQDDVTKLSELPSREVLLATLLGTIQAPVTRLMGAMNAKSRELLSLLSQYSDQKGGNENG